MNDVIILVLYELNRSSYYAICAITYFSFALKGIAGIAYADEEYAVVVECDEVREDGTCYPSELVVEVLSRRSTPLSHADIDKLAPVAERLCLEKEDFHLIPHDSKYKLILLIQSRNFTFGN